MVCLNANLQTQLLLCQGVKEFKKKLWQSLIQHHEINFLKK